MDNPLLQASVLPKFQAIQADHVVPAIEKLIADCRAKMSEVIAANQNEDVSWETLVAPLEEQGDLLSKAWSPVGHLNAVMNNDDLRDAYEKAVAMMTAYGTEVGQNADLYRAYQALQESDSFKTLSTERKTAVEQELRDFRLAGVDLPTAEKKEYADIQQRLSELSTRFANQVMDATQGWTKHVTDDSALAGLPESAKALAAQAAHRKDLQGYLVTLDIPSYLAIMKYADNRALREEVYSAYVTRASDQGPNAGQWDNSPLIDEILSLRHRAAKLLGFNNYAERSLATKMAETPEQVETFLLELAAKSRAAAQEDMAELTQFAKQEDGLEELQAWDVSYYSEKLKQEKYSVSQEELRPYFPVDRVLTGLFGIVEKLFDVSVVPAKAEVWHPDVKFFELQRDGQTIASFYFDLFARENKRGGAWMDECRNRRRTEEGTQLPVAYMVCNFAPGTGDQPALLTHDEVLTLFHEFGHGLHHMLTRIETSSVSGIHGVAWDAVELPSQFLENWCWEAEALALISGHFETGDPLPSEMLNNLLKARNFQSGMMMLRQLEFALFDLRLHRFYNPEAPESPQSVIDNVRSDVAVSIPPSFNRFQNSFTHIFAGGYAAGYYSYKWAEVLSSDAFSKFEEEGIFNPDTGRSFREEILEKGGSEDAMSLFINFRGRSPSPDALLRHSGIAGE